MKAYTSPLQMMANSGGAFVKTLTECYLRADHENKRRLKAAFPEIFDYYDRAFERHLAIVAQENGRAA